MDTPEFNVGRGEATLIQMRNDLQEGLEGKDIVHDVIRGVRNAFVAGWHGLQGIIPTIANTVSGQRYNVVQRAGPFHGTVNSVQKIVQTKGILGKASAVFAEATDGPVDDGLNVVGGSQWIITPAQNVSRLETQARNDFHARLAA